MQILNQDIKDKTFRRVYLLFGDEPFLVNSYKKRLREAIAGDDTMNYNYFEGKGPDVKEIISLADTMPFFAERRLVLIDGSGFFKSSARVCSGIKEAGRGPADALGSGDPFEGREEDHAPGHGVFYGADRG